MRAKNIKFLRLLADSDLSALTLMPLLTDTLKSLIPAYEVAVIHVNERAEPTTYYTEKFSPNSHEMFTEAGHELANNTLRYDDSNAKDPAAFQVLFEQPQAVGNLVPVTAEYLAGATYRFFFQPNGIYHVLDIAIKAGNQPIAIIGLFRQKNEPAFTAKDVQLVEKIYDILCHILMKTTSVADNSRLFIEASTLITVDDSGAIVAAAPDAESILCHALACKERAILSKDKQLPPSCLAFQRNVMQLVSKETAETYLDVPFGRLHLRAYPLADSPTAACGIHIDFYGDIAEALLAYLRTTELSAKLIEIAYFAALGHDLPALQQRLTLQYSSLKTYLNRIYSVFNVGDLSSLRQTLTEQAQQFTKQQRQRRCHVLY